MNHRTDKTTVIKVDFLKKKKPYLVDYIHLYPLLRWIRGSGAQRREDARCGDQPTQGQTGCVPNRTLPYYIVNIAWKCDLKCSLNWAHGQRSVCRHVRRYGTTNHHNCCYTGYFKRFIEGLNKLFFFIGNIFCSRIWLWIMEAKTTTKSPSSSHYFPSILVCPVVSKNVIQSSNRILSETNILLKSYCKLQKLFLGFWNILKYVYRNYRV